MKEIKLLLSDEDIAKIEKQIMFDGHCRKLIIKVTGICFTENPATIDYVEGELE